MADVYDVLGQLDDLCASNIGGRFKNATFALDQSNKPEVSSDDDLRLEDELGNRMNKNTKSPLVCVSPVSIQLSPPPAKRQSPAKAKAKQAPIIEQDNPPPEQILEVPQTRNTRSSLRRKVAEAEAEALKTPPQVETIPARRKGRGRGRRSKNQMESLSSESTEIPTIEIAESGPVEPFIMQLFRRQKRKDCASGNDVMRARRNYIGEIAARSTNVEYVDLVSSPIPRIEGVINVDADSEGENNFDTETSTTVKKNELLDFSFDEENPEVSVKINWNGKTEIFKLRKYQKFAHIFKTLAEREATSVENIVFNLNNKILSANDTPASIDYKIFQFINGRVLVGSLNDSNLAAPSKKRDANKISLKIQSDKWKRPLQVDMFKTDTFKILYIKCAEELNTTYDNMKLSFDGDLLELNATPADLDMEGGEAIDLRIKN